ERADERLARARRGGEPRDELLRLGLHEREVHLDGELAAAADAGVHRAAVAVVTRHRRADAAAGDAGVGRAGIAIVAHERRVAAGTRDTAIGGAGVAVVALGVGRAGRVHAHRPVVDRRDDRVAAGAGARAVAAEEAELDGGARGREVGLLAAVEAARAEGREAAGGRRLLALRRPRPFR